MINLRAHRIPTALAVAAALCLTLLMAGPVLAGMDDPPPPAQSEQPLGARWQGPGWQVVITQRGPLLEVVSWSTSDPSQTGGPARAEVAALKAARYMAYAKLRQFLADLSSLPGRPAPLRGVAIFDERVSRTEVGEVRGEVVLRMPFSGDAPQPRQQAQDRARAPKPAPLKSEGQNIFRPRPGGYEVARPARPYTGLIVVARGVGARPAMFPTIVEQSTGREVYGVEHADPEEAFNLGAGSYALSLAKARRLPRVGDNPLVVHATQAQGDHHASLVVSYPQAVRIYEANQRGNFLARCAVVVVIDPLVGRR